MGAQARAAGSVAAVVALVLPAGKLLGVQQGLFIVYQQVTAADCDAGLT